MGYARRQRYQNTTSKGYGVTIISELLLAASSAALATQAAPAPAPAPQDQPPAVSEPAQAAPVADAATQENEGEDIVVTGTRVVGRSRLDSVSPVDVLSGASLQRQG